MKQSGYQTRINKKLAELSIAIDPATLVKFGLARKHGEAAFESGIAGGEEWNFTNFRYGHMDCELCNHKNIRRIFTIQCKANGNKLDIGSECAKNYIDSDLVDGLCRVFNVEYNKIVNPIKFEDALEILNWAVETKEFHNLSSFRSHRYNLINYGDAGSVIRKINLGKNITKREKEVIAFWKHVKDNQELVTHFNNQFVANAEKRRAAWEAQRQAAHEARLAVYKRNRVFRDLASVFRNIRHNNLQLAARSQKHCQVLGNFLVNAVVYVETKRVKTLAEKVIASDEERGKGVAYTVVRYIDAGWNVSDRQIAALEKAVAPKTATIEIFGTKELVEKVNNASLSGWSVDFVRSVTAFYNKNGNISQKQFNVLNKIAKKAGL